MGRVAFPGGVARSSRSYGYAPRSTPGQNPNPLPARPMATFDMSSRHSLGPSHLHGLIAAIAKLGAIKTCSTKSTGSSISFVGLMSFCKKPPSFSGLLQVVSIQLIRMIFLKIAVAFDVDWADLSL